MRRRLVEEAKAELDALAAELRHANGRRVDTRAAWDSPRDAAVARAAGAFGAGLVVIAPARGRRGFRSSDWRLIAHCPAPVLVVNGDGLEPYARILAAVDPVHAHAKPEDLDDAIVACAKAVQARTGGSLSVLHCFESLARFESEDIDRTPLADAERALERSRQQALDPLARRAGLGADATRLAEGRPEDVLESLAGSSDCDLIVMGGLSRGRLKDFVIGSTAERVLAHVGCDVLVVKPPPVAADLAPTRP